MAGEIKLIRPNPIQKILHRIVSLRPISIFFSTRMHRMDFFLLKLTGGKHTFSELAGWTIIQLTTIGARTGQPRTVPLVASMTDDKIILIASSFGREHNPGWYYNLKRHSSCAVNYAGRSMSYEAWEARGDDYEKYWNVAVSNNSGYESYRKHTHRQHIPVMVLEPKK